jgi:hypothetical protein
VCSRPRSGDGARSCAALPDECLTARLHAVDPDLGPLVECSGLRPRLLFIEPHGRSQAAVRHEIALPDGDARAVRLLGDTLYVVTHAGELWRWDLSAPPSGMLPLGSSGPSTLVHGTFAALAAHLNHDTPELRRLRWNLPGGAPMIDHLPLPALAGLIPLRAAADPDGFVAAFAPPPPSQADGALVFGGIPLARPGVVRRPIDAPRLARARDGLTVALPTGDAVDLLDLAAPTTPVRIAAPTPSDALVAAAFHPDGQHLALAWTSGAAVLAERRTGAARPLAPPDPLPCSESDPAARRVTALAYAPAGDWLAVGHASGRLDLLPLGADARPVPSASPASLCRHAAALTAIAFTPDGETVLSGSERGDLAFWSGFHGGVAVADAEEIFLWLPDRPPIAELTATDEHVLALTAAGDLWYTHATFDAPGLRRRLDERARLCLKPAERVTMLAEDPAAAAAAELSCPFRHVLTERDLP